MKNKELIEKFVDALVTADKKFLWEHRSFRSDIVDPEEKAYMRKLMFERLPELRQIVNDRFGKNEREFKEVLKRFGIETHSPEL